MLPPIISANQFGKTNIKPPIMRRALSQGVKPPIFTRQPSKPDARRKRPTLIMMNV
jgi:hypothetical protein